MSTENNKKKRAITDFFGGVPKKICSESLVHSNISHNLQNVSASKACHSTLNDEDTLTIHQNTFPSSVDHLTLNDETTSHDHQNNSPTPVEHSSLNKTAPLDRQNTSPSFEINSVVNLDIGNYIGSRIDELLLKF